MKTRFEDSTVETNRVERYVAELSRCLEDLSETRKAEELEEIRLTFLPCSQVQATIKINSYHSIDGKN